MRKVSPIVNGFTHTHSTALPSAHSTAEKTSASRRVSSPLAVARQAVRAILASMCCSMRQLKAAAAPATSQMPATAATSRTGSGQPGWASSMPMRAQNTMSCTTRGLVSS